MDNNTQNQRKVAIGLSGGVDSSVSAALLVEQGYEVTGVFLECWRGPGCRVDEDRKDALDVALKLGIPFQILDFKQAYYDRVVDYFYREYQAGRTPNPDTMCNREIKFGLFYDWAMKNGFDYVATGHYSRIQKRQETRHQEQADQIIQSSAISHESYDLQRGKDSNKDQSYFLYQLHSKQLAHILFPIGHLTKAQVRQEAKKRGLATAAKPDSQGICFIGPVNIQSFLKERIKETKGKIVIKDTRDQDQDDKLAQTIKIKHKTYLVVGFHTGIAFHTIGQKVGEEIDQALVAKLCKQGILDFDPANMPPLFVIEKNAQDNLLVVGTENQLYQDTFAVEEVSWLVKEYESWSQNPAVSDETKVRSVCIRIRNLGEIVPAEIMFQHNQLFVTTKQPIKAVAAGQACVFYRDQSADAVVLGGGVISEIKNATSEN